MAAAASTSAVDLFGDTQPWQTKIYQKRLAVNVLVCANPKQFTLSFAGWLDLNWPIWLAFEREASRIWDRGRRHYSARTIGEWLRHETAMREGPNEHGFKLNNSVIPDMGRLYALVHPGRDRFFERRVSPTSARSV